jgi:hypothetical protein
MKTILLTTLATLFLAAPALASGFPEKAESRVWNTQKSYVGDVMVKLPLKAADRIGNRSDTISFGSTEALAAGEVVHLPLKAMDR